MSASYLAAVAIRAADAPSVAADNDNMPSGSTIVSGLTNVVPATTTRPLRELLDLHAVLLQCVVECMLACDYAAFSRTCTACHASSAGALLVW